MLYEVWTARLCEGWQRAYPSTRLCHVLVPSPILLFSHRSLSWCPVSGSARCGTQRQSTPRRQGPKRPEKQQITPRGGSCIRERRSAGAEAGGHAVWGGRQRDLAQRGDGVGFSGREEPGINCQSCRIATCWEDGLWHWDDRHKGCRVHRGAGRLEFKRRRSGDPQS